MALAATARAKVNLSLRVLGRRPDGFHAIDSLVAFADFGDTLTSSASQPRGVQTFGPFASAIVGENLVERAIALALKKQPALEIGQITIEKLVPVAAGIGGGSADAAAALRLIRSTNPRYADAVDWDALATELGSDVPVCFRNVACRMTGRGEILTPLTTLAAFPAVLINPQVAVPSDKTRQVFKYFAAQQAPAQTEPISQPFGTAQTHEEWLSVLRQLGNDLEPAATLLMPVIADVLAELRFDPRTCLARLSGAGPTCFALMKSSQDAHALADALSVRHPSWWVRVTQVG